MGRFFKAFLVFFALLAAVVVLQQYAYRFSGSKIGVVYLNGPITEEKAQEVVSLLKEAASRKDIAGIVLRIDSPGGAVAPSQELFQYLMQLRGKKRVYASISTLGASGAYYAACGCSKIYADAGSLVGSIGVIFTVTQIKELLSKLGISAVVVKSGRFKDTGSPFREMTPEERKYIESLLKDIHAQFVKDVATARGLSLERVKAVADGRVFTGNEAVKLGLIDGVKPYWQVVEVLSKDLGYKEALPTVVFKRKKGFWERLKEETLSFVRDIKAELLRGELL